MLICISDGVSRLGLGLETRLETRFWSLGLEGLRSRLGLGLEGFRSRSRALRLETLHRLFFIKFCKKEFLWKTEMIFQNSAVQRGQWLSFFCCYVVCEMAKTICPLPRLKFILSSIKNVHAPMKLQRVISAAGGWEYFAKNYLWTVFPWVLLWNP